MPTTKQYLNEIIDQKKALATNITAKGITASETELLNTLVPKVAQIENLKGEERTLENFTGNVLSEPKNNVQLNFPEANKIITAQLGSKNIIPYPYYHTTRTENGVTWTVNDDRSIPVSGTATEQSGFIFASYLLINSAYTYIFSFNATDVANLTLQLSEYDKDKSVVKTLTTTDFSQSYTYTPSASNVEFISISIKRTQNAACSGTVKLQLEYGTIASPYSNYIADFSNVEVVRTDGSGGSAATYQASSSGLVTGIASIAPITDLDFATDFGAVFTSVTGETYKEITPSAGKNAITKVYQPAVTNNIDSNIISENIKKDVSILGVTGDYICNYTYDETTKELVLIL